jgi:hypothetical protein
MILIDPHHLADIAYRISRLSIDRRDPEAFFINRSEIAGELRALAGAGHLQSPAEWPGLRQAVVTPPAPVPRITRSSPAIATTASAISAAPVVSTAPSQQCTCSAHRPRPRRRRRYRRSPMVCDPRQPALRIDPSPDHT